MEEKIRKILNSVADTTYFIALIAAVIWVFVSFADDNSLNCLPYASTSLAFFVIASCLKLNQDGFLESISKWTAIAGAKNAKNVDNPTDNKEIEQDSNDTQTPQKNK